MYNVYLVCSQIDGNKLYKIGYTRREIEKRIKEFKTGNASEFYIVDSFRSKWGTKIESQLHRYFRRKKISGEWFDLSDDDINDFKKQCNLIHNNLEVISTENLYYLEKRPF
jgi:hypothetical protein